MRSSNSLLVIILLVAGGYIAWKYVIEPSTKTVHRGETVERGEGHASVQGPSVYRLKDKLKKADSAVWRFENHICLYCKRKENCAKIEQEVDIVNDKIAALNLPNPSDANLASSKYDFYRKWRKKTHHRINKIGDMTLRYYKVRVKVTSLLESGESSACSRSRTAGR